MLVVELLYHQNWENLAHKHEVIFEWVNDYMVIKI